MQSCRSFLICVGLCSNIKCSYSDLICLFGVFRPTENFSLIRRRHNRPVKDWTRHSWPLSSEGSIACHIYCDTGHPFIMFISYIYCRSFSSGAVTSCFYDLGLLRLGIEHPTSACEANPLSDCATAAVHSDSKTNFEFNRS